MSGEIFNLDGKVVLVTGAAQGLGAAIGNACAVQGAAVVLADIEQQQVGEVASAIREKTGGPVVAHACDVRDKDQVQQLVQSVVTDQGRIDVLVNNAGIHRRVDPLDISPADLKAVLT
ncbi:MAG: SDR family NAD(P)-dependent oxidoreductase [Planctomycetota bacterium]|nr:SDR family NAD(P)-dependent oxidoreductase [Planctomycetota bacterium]